LLPNRFYRLSRLVGFFEIEVLEYTFYSARHWRACVFVCCCAARRVRACIAPLVSTLPRHAGGVLLFFARRQRSVRSTVRTHRRALSLGPNHAPPPSPPAARPAPLARALEPARPLLRNARHWSAAPLRTPNRRHACAPNAFDP
jgi:hypothetical protein